MSTTIIILGSLWLLAHIIKWLFWSGVYPPNSGWSKRQMDRIQKIESPWTWQCWITYYAERNVELRAAMIEKDKLI